MKVAVYGLGYVGSVTASCLADRGNMVVGVDIDEDKVRQIQNGTAPVIEPGLDDIITRCVSEGSLSAINSMTAQLPVVDVHLVCVGTPSRVNGSLETDYVKAVVGEIGRSIRQRHAAGHGGTGLESTNSERFSPVPHPVVVIRSTVLPGTVDEEIIPVLEDAVGRSVGDGFSVAMCPEFLRETTAVIDFADPPFTVAGVSDSHAESVLRQLFDFAPSEFHSVDLRTAETIKYACNAFHALKVSFANEVGRFASRSGGDSRRAMEIFVQDTQLNISAAYLRPGFAFGGSCLPKDLQALTHRARMLDLDLPLINNILTSNDQHLRATTELVLAHHPASVGMLGLAFKTGTDDLRESPFVRLAETLLGKGIDVRIWDPDLRTELLVGKNRTFVDRHLPHLARLLRTTAAEVVEGSDVVVLGSNHGDASLAIEQGSCPVLVDLIGRPQLESLVHHYSGAAW